MNLLYLINVKISMRYLSITFLLCIVYSNSLFSQEDLPLIIEGTIYELSEDNEQIPLIGANLRWLNAPNGAVTDENGQFLIGRIKATNLLIVSYVGYKSDTVDMADKATLELNLEADLTLSEVLVEHRRKSSEISFVNPIQTTSISEEELCKAACCNLSESFETSPSIDVSITDAVTGTKQIQMLGLAGKYVQISRESIPDIRGLAAISGLTYTPGFWVESIQLSKGTGSVVNGFESLTGQINIELRKPEDEENFYLNLYGNQGGRYEGNLSLKHQFNEKLSTGFLLHGSDRSKRIDHNHDEFLDMPLIQNFIGINRWKYEDQEKGLVAQVGLKLTKTDATSGNRKFDKHHDLYSEDMWGMNNAVDRYEFWTKSGKNFNNKNNSSIGLQLSGLVHDQKTVFGTNEYIGDQKSFYANLLYNQDIGNEKHKIITGISYLWDDVKETAYENQFDRTEHVPGVFAEYIFKPDAKFTLVGGLRGDLHNIYGAQITPRLHLRYAANDQTVFRLVGGKGWRTANIFAEHPGIFASNRQVEIIPFKNNSSELPYGLNPEQAWNMGANVTRTLYLGQREATLSLDYYYTLFQDQIIADLESSSDGRVIFRNQDFNSWGQSAQIQLDAEPIANLDVRLAYRYNYSEAKYGSEIKSTPLNSFHRAFINIAYNLKDSWHFDYTLNFRGKQRIPNTDWLPETYQLDSESPVYFLSNAQVRKIFNDNFELYVGVENIFNYKQENPIIAPFQPFSKNFDASIIYAPIFGRNFYGGLRYKI